MMLTLRNLMLGLELEPRAKTVISQFFEGRRRAYDIVVLLGSLDSLYPGILERLEDHAKKVCENPKKTVPALCAEVIGICRGMECRGPALLAAALKGYPHAAPKGVGRRRLAHILRASEDEDGFVDAALAEPTEAVVAAEEAVVATEEDVAAAEEAVVATEDSESQDAEDPDDESQSGDLGVSPAVLRRLVLDAVSEAMTSLTPAIVTAVSEVVAASVRGTVEETIKKAMGDDSEQATPSAELRKISGLLMELCVGEKREPAGPPAAKVLVPLSGGDRLLARLHQTGP